jgi:hypothetical protein
VKKFLGTEWGSSNKSRGWEAVEFEFSKTHIMLE